MSAPPAMVSMARASQGLYPGLASAPSVRAADPQSLIRVVLRGARSVATDQAPTAPAMPAFAWQLSDDQIAAVLTYLRNERTARANPIEAARVLSERAALPLRNN
jgi:mono/diheme cytochrome c family protein